MPLNKPPECYNCPLEHKGIGFSKPDGLGTLDIAIVGEHLSSEDAHDGLPFRKYSAGGSKLEECIRMAGEELGMPLTRNHFKVYNIIACNPPHDRFSGTYYEYGAIEHCKKNFHKVIEPHNERFRLIEQSRSNRVLDNVSGNLDHNGSTGNDSSNSSARRFKAILALGNVPLRTLTKVSGIAEDKQSIHYLRGYVLPSAYGPVIGSHDPKFIKRGNTQFTPTLVEDIKKAIRVANETYNNYPSYPEYKAPKYIETPSLDDAWGYYHYAANNLRLPISYDIETTDTISSDEDEREDFYNNTTIIQVQFSVHKSTGIALPWKGEYIEVIKAIFRLKNHKFGFNCWNFDNPILKGNGVSIEGSTTWDIMVMFAKWHPSLTRKLQNVASLFDFPFAWKHLFGSQLQFYGCADTDSVLQIAEKLIPLMKARGVWQHYVDQVYGLYPILQRASDKGLPVNDNKRLELKDILEKRKEGLVEELQKDVPDEIKNLSPKRKEDNGTVTYGYKRPPSTLKDYEGLYYQFCEYNSITPNTPELSFRRYVKECYGLVLRNFTEVGENGETIEISRWCRLEPFNPSSQQLQKYIAYKQTDCEKSLDEDIQELAKHYKIPLSLKTGNPTTGKKELQEILEKTGDLVLDKCMQVRSLTTNITNYIPNWQPANDGCVHTQWSFVQPQEQLATRAPNIQNCSKHTEIGQEFRGIIEAPKGRVFLECDKKSFHVATMGYVAKDQTYIRFSQLDPHSIFTSFIHERFKSKPVDFNWSDNDILEYCKEIKSYCKKEKENGGAYGLDMRQDIAKVCVLGNQLGLGPKKLWIQNRKAIKNINHAKNLQSQLAEIFPKVEAAKKYFRDYAHNHHYLMTEWGDIQYFYDVYTKQFLKKRNEWVQHNGDDAEKCLAKMVQSTAFGMIKYEILEMERQGILDRFWFCNTIHDSVMFIPLENEIEECEKLITHIMNSACKMLVNEATGPAGLIVKVESSIGRNWKHYHDKHTEKCKSWCTLNLEGMR